MHRNPNHPINVLRKVVEVENLNDNSKLEEEKNSEEHGKFLFLISFTLKTS